VNSSGKKFQFSERITMLVFSPGSLKGGEYNPVDFARQFYPVQNVDKRSRTLVFCPTARIERQTVDGILSQKDSGFLDLMLTQDNPYPQDGGEVYRNIQLNYEKMRRIALNEDYDNIWVVESDMVLPDDALSKLKSLDADVATGVYMLRTDPPRLNVSPFDRDGDIAKCNGGSMGCVLLKRRVLFGFSFIRDDPFPPDIEFMEYCKDSNFNQLCHFGVRCGHIQPSGEILWPQ
jgi:hypothetical protein